MPDGTLIYANNKFIQKLGFTDNKDTERPFGKSVYDIIYEQVNKYDYPICFGFPVSHERENYALKIGESYTLHVGESVSLMERP